ncbi:MAG TPA: hypothetical protein VEB68_12620 [Croceibacterium sp.]|nr:hypothetical protein [Croceibacterium sp.]
MLRRLYEEALKDPAAKHSASALLAPASAGQPDHILALIVAELAEAKLVSSGTESPTAEAPLELTAKGYYEAEQLGGSFRTPALARITKLIKDHQLLSLVVAVLGVVVAVGYPEFKAWQSQRQIGPTIERYAAQADYIQAGQRGLADIEMAFAIDERCRADPSAKEYDGVSCEVSRGERAPTVDEARAFCLRFPAAIHLGGIDCQQFHR